MTTGTVYGSERVLHTLCRGLPWPTWMKRTLTAVMGNMRRSDRRAHAGTRDSRYVAGATCRLRVTRPSLTTALRRSPPEPAPASLVVSLLLYLARRRAR